MLLTQIGVAFGLTAVGFSDPASSLGLTVAAALMVAFSSATQDVVIDGWRINVAETSRQGMMAAAYQLGYRLALICAGAGALYMAEYVNWHAAYFVMAALTGIGMIGTLLAPSPSEATGGKSLSFASAVIEPLRDLFERKGLLLIPILLLVGLFRLPDFVAGVMANPLYIDLGFAKTDIANVSKLYGVWVGIAGAFAGGFALTRIGLWPALLIGAVFASASHLMLAWLALAGARLDLLTLAISVENFASGFAGSALIAYMSSLTSPGFAATQYALLSSLYALPGKFIGGFSGAVVDRWGYPALFMATATIAVPLVVLCLIVRRDTMQPKDAAENREPEAPGPVEARPAPSRA
jgi:PAT family beta-lactamase induction signal transducer AmpG